MEKTKLSVVVKALRKEYGLTQENLAMKSVVGLSFIRNLEQGKATLRMDNVNQLLDFFKKKYLYLSFYPKKISIFAIK